MATLFILSAPSGAGKTTVAERVLNELEGIRKVVTATTRKPRPGERHGVDYLFLTEEEFKKGIEEGRFLEYANVYGNYYGTPKDQVEKNMEEGYDSLLVIDVQGAFKIKGMMPSAVTVFLLPPSMEELKRRIENRGFRDENLQTRLKTAEGEIPCVKFFDYVIVNDFIDKAVLYLKSIIIAKRCERDSVLRNIGKILPGKEIAELIKGGECYVKKT